MRLVRPVTEVLERIYDVELPAQAWVESVRSAAARCFEGFIGIQTYLLQVGASGSFQCHEIASDEQMERVFRKAHALASPDVIRAIYQSGPVVRLGRVLAGYETDPGYRTALNSDMGNITLALGMDPSGIGCALVFAQGCGAGLTRGARHVLERISAHLGSACRLRGLVSTPAHACETDAVISADGVVLHAERDARGPEARRALREAARRVDRARSSSAGSEPADALGLWRALVDGRWSLMERFDSDGRRMFVARRNDPSVRANDRLSEKERKVVALLAVGHSVKLCAYELGFAQSTVSDLARSGMRKMGVRSRAELVDLHGSIIAASEVVPRTAPTTGRDP